MHVNVSIVCPVLLKGHQILNYRAIKKSRSYEIEISRKLLYFSDSRGCLELMIRQNYAKTHGLIQRVSKKTLPFEI